MLKQHQAEISTQLEELLDSVCDGPLPVADRLELRRLVDALCGKRHLTEAHRVQSRHRYHFILQLIPQPSSAAPIREMWCRMLRSLGSRAAKTNLVQDSENHI